MREHPDSPPESPSPPPGGAPWSGPIPDAMREALTKVPSLHETVRVGEEPPPLPRRRVPAWTAQRTLAGPDADFRLLEMVGRGGMGIVYEAVQASLDRIVAVKRVRPGEASEGSGARRFLREAALTGRLEHPNIIPVHDVGQDEDGQLFYVMKLVEGRAWSTLLPEQPLDMNLGFLQRVMDAMAFAHAQGVVHRDLKPGNVMLGTFGEVYVVDWGLAAPIPSPDTPEGEGPLLMGGTPPYMPPEIATGEGPSAAPSVDIYLLGAILFEILTGAPPHPGQTPTECYMNAGWNVLRPHDASGELMAIALKALATRPEDRFPSVRAFQEALRSHASHAESHALASAAADAARQARADGDHATYQGAVFGFREALRCWPENPEAREGLSRTLAAYAEAACQRGDLDLAASLLDPGDPAHGDLAARVERARRAHRGRIARMRALVRASYTLVAALVGTLAVSTVLVRAQKQRALAAHAAELLQRRETERALYRLGLAQALRLAGEGKASDGLELIETLPREPRGWEYDVLGQRLRDHAGTTERVFTGHTGRVYALAVSPDGRWVASGAGEVRIWATADGSEHRLIRGEADWKGGNALAFSPDGRLLALGDGTVWTMEGTATCFTLSGHADDLAALAFSPDGSLLASADWAGLIQLWYVPGGSLAGQLRDGRGPVTRLAFAPDGRSLLWGSRDGTVQVAPLSPEGPGPPRRLGGLASSVMSVAWSGQGRLAAGAKDGTLRFWEAPRGSGRLLPPTGSGIPSLAFDPEGRWLAGGSVDGVVRVWDARTGERALELKGHKGMVIPVAFLPDGRLASGSHDGTVRLWRLPPGASPPEGSGSENVALQFLDGNRLGIGCRDGTLRLWDPRRQQLLWKVPLPQGCAAALATDGRHLYSAGRDGLVRKVDATDGRLLPLPAAPGPELLALAVHGDRLATGGKDRVVRLRLASNGRMLQELRDLEDWTGALAFSPDGGFLAAATVGGGLHAWETRTWREVLAVKGTEGRYMKPVTVSFSPTGDRLACGAWDKAVELWDTRTWTRLRRLEGPTGWALGAWTPDGRHLSVSLDGSLRVWDPATGGLLLTLPLPPGVPGALALDPGGRAATLVGGGLLLWN